MGTHLGGGLQWGAVGHGHGGAQDRRRGEDHGGRCWMGQRVQGLGCGGDAWRGGRTPTPVPRDIPSSPNTFPQWAQKKCSGCQVWSRAVRTFCRKQGGEAAGGSKRGRGGGGGLVLTSRMGLAQ